MSFFEKSDAGGDFLIFWLISLTIVGTFWKQLPQRDNVPTQDDHQYSHMGIPN
jgi:hypothetical protein